MITRLLANKGHLERLRAAFFAFVAVNLCITLLTLLVDGDTAHRLRAPAIVANLFLLGWWTYGYKRSFKLPLDLIEAGCMLMIGLAVGQPEKAFGVFYIGTFFRSLYDSTMRATIRGLFFLGAFLIMVINTPGHIDVMTRVIPHIIGIVFTSGVVQIMKITLGSHDRALVRERTLRSFAVELSTTRDDDAMVAAAMTALLTLAGEDMTARVGMATGDSDEMRVIAAEGNRADEARSGVVLLAGFPDEIISQLRDGQVVTVGDQGSTWHVTTFDRKRNGTYLPLLCRGELVGLLAFTSDVDIPDELTAALTTVASQASIWIEARRNNEAAREAHTARAELLTHLVTLQEEERKIIAADIHDDPIQQMTAVAIRLGMLVRSATDEKSKANAAKLEAMVSGCIGRLRRLMFSLRPPALDRDGLASAIRDQLDATMEDARFEWDVVTHLDAEPATELRVTAFRITQEAIANIRKHARPMNVKITLRSIDNGISVVVEDDGCGFDLDAFNTIGRGHIGMSTMRERAELASGRFGVWSKVGVGTRVEFWLPQPGQRPSLEAA